MTRGAKMFFGIFIAIFVIAIAVGASSNSGNNSSNLAACGMVRSIAADSANGTLAASDLPQRVTDFYNQSIIGTPQLQDGALKMKQAITAIQNNSSTDVSALYSQGLAEALQACTASGN